MGYIKLTILIILVNFCSLKLTGQSASIQMGARVIGMGNVASPLFDPWGLLNNIAGIAKTDAITVAGSQELQLQLQGANRTAFIGILPIKQGACGLGVFKFGDDLYSENLISGGFSHQLGLASIGVRTNYVQYRSEGFGSRGAASFDMGGIAELTSKFYIGASITNISQSKITKELREPLPTKMILGLGFKPNEKVYLVTELEKDILYKASIKAGVEYLIHKKISVRTGYNLYPSIASFGLGFKANKFQLDYALQYNTVLSTTHQASVSYQFKRI